MTATATAHADVSPRYRWDVDSFLRAHEAGAFDGARVELVDGEVWRVVLGDWHGGTVGRVIALLREQGHATTSTLASGASLPDPDVWVRRPDARPTGSVLPRLSRWDPSDVLLVVEVSDESVEADLTTKARLYARSGYGRYWVVVRDGVHEHTDPGEEGYARVRHLGPQDSVELPDGSTLAVRDLLED